MKDSEKAQATLSRLRKEYPDSAEAQNALFALAINLQKLGLRNEATETYRLMLEEDAEYSTSQMLLAGKNLLDSEEYALALRAFNRGLELNPSETQLRHLTLYQAQAKMGAGASTEAIELLEQYLTEYPKSAGIIDANLLLAKALSQLASKTADAEQRMQHFNKAVDALKFVQRYQKTRPDKALMDIEVGRLLILKSLAENEFGTPATVRKYQDQAIAAYQSLILTADATDGTLALELAYTECLPLLVKTERWLDTVDDATEFLRLYPQSRHAVDVENWLNRAKVQLTTE